MKTLILDPDAEMLTRMIGRCYPDCTIVGSHSSYQEGRLVLEQEQLDLAIVSLDLPDADGLELLERLTQRDCVVVISSEWATFAYEALRGGAIDYLLRPHVDEELSGALQRASRRVREKQLLEKTYPADREAGPAGSFFLRVDPSAPHGYRLACA